MRFSLFLIAVSFIYSAVSRTSYRVRRQAGAVQSKILPNDEQQTFDGLAEAGGDFQGDIILNAAQQSPTNRFALVDTTRRWPDNTVCYFFDFEEITTIGLQDDFTKDSIMSYLQKEVRILVREAAEIISNKTCIRFIERTASEAKDRSCIRVIHGENMSCSSYLGMKGKGQWQTLTLGLGCESIGTVLHEIMHSLGFGHEQSRPDRDYYIELHEDSIKKEFLRAYAKGSNGFSDFFLPYDYNSVMHYRSNFFADDHGNHEKTMTARGKSETLEVGQRKGLSEVDVKKLKKAYNCDNSLPVKPLLPTQVDYISIDAEQIDMLLNEINRIRSTVGASNMNRLECSDKDPYYEYAVNMTRKCEDPGLDTLYETKDASFLRIVTTYLWYSSALFETLVDKLRFIRENVKPASLDDCCKKTDQRNCTLYCKPYFALQNPSLSIMSCHSGRCEGLLNSALQQGVSYLSTVCYLNSNTQNAAKLNMAGKPCQNCPQGAQCDNKTGLCIVQKSIRDRSYQRYYAMDEYNLDDVHNKLLQFFSKHLYCMKLELKFHFLVTNTDGTGEITPYTLFVQTTSKIGFQKSNEFGVVDYLVLKTKNEKFPKLPQPIKSDQVLLNYIGIYKKANLMVYINGWTQKNGNKWKFLTWVGVEAVWEGVESMGPACVATMASG